MTAKQDNIVERLYIKGTLEAVSPLIVGSGEDELADIQLVRDWKRTPFIPGTAIAGAARHYLDEACASANGVEKGLVNILFGQKAKKDNDTTQSLITFYDANPRGNIHEKLALRDGVALDFVTKTAKKGEKYDYEIIERGQQFDFRIEVLFRACHNGNRNKMKDLLFALLTALNNGQIAFGAKTRRGFGMVKLIDENVLALNIANSPDDVKHWMKFRWDDASSVWNDSSKDYTLSQLQQGMLTSLNVHHAEVSATFKIPYSILIRHYSSDPQDPDTSHLTSLYPLEDGQRKPFSIIPGTSWNGAIRHAIHHILRDLNQPKTAIEAITNGLFGYDVDETKKEARASRVLVRESRIDGGEQLAYTRNKVDRFTGGVVDSALFDEKAHYEGQVTLHITIKTDQNVPEDQRGWEVGLLLLALQDIGNGVQPVGGAANIGRGILDGEEFTVNGYKIRFGDDGDERYHTYMQALYRHLTKKDTMR